MLPVTIGDMSWLEFGYFNDNLFTGAIPQQIGNLEWLKELNLKDNDLTGEVSTPICNMNAEIKVDCEVTCTCCTDYVCEDDDATDDDEF